MINAITPLLLMFSRVARALVSSSLSSGASPHDVYRTLCSGALS